MNHLLFYLTCIGFFTISVLLSFLINWLFLKFSQNLGIRNHEELNQIRWKTDVKPSIGGFSFFILFLISISVLNNIPFEGDIFNKELVGILAASTLGFIIGLADDAYNTNPLVKFIGQLTCAFILIVMDVYIRLTGNMAIDFGITCIWVIGLMNSINMLDNMDGITASVGSAIIFTGALFVFTDNQYNDAFLILLLGVLGTLLGFLYFNWNPAKIYMGDTGSQFLGVFLAAIGIIFFWDKRDIQGSVFQIKQFVIPLLIFIVPIIDTTTVFIRRLARKQSPFVGGKDHITHHLALYGFTEKQVALVLISISLFSTVICTVLHIGLFSWTWIISLICFAYFLIVFFIIQYVYEKGKKQLLQKK